MADCYIILFWLQWWLHWYLHILTSNIHLYNVQFLYVNFTSKKLLLKVCIFFSHYAMKSTKKLSKYSSSLQKLLSNYVEKSSRHQWMSTILTMYLVFCFGYIHYCKLCYLQHSCHSSVATIGLVTDSRVVVKSGESILWESIGSAEFIVECCLCSI